MRVRGALYFVLAFAATAAVIEWHVVLSLDLISTLTTDTSSTASPLRRSLGIQEATTAISDNCAAYRADCDRIMGELDVSPPCPVTSGRAASCHTLATVGVARSLLVRFWGFFPPTDASHGCISWTRLSARSRRSQLSSRPTLRATGPTRSPTKQPLSPFSCGRTHRLNIPPYNI